MKKVVLSFIWVCMTMGAFSQDSLYHTTAILLLDRMSDVIGDMTSCSFKTVSSHDVADPDNGMIKQFVTSKVYMAGPDKMLINFWGPKGHRQCWYNGDHFAIYDFEENNYGIIDAPSTIMATIDSIHAQYAIEFPAADFFYPAFTDDLLESSSRIDFLGRATIDGQECFQISAKGKDMTTQIWISNDAYNLPIKYVITYNSKTGNPQYEATFSDWQINPDLPSAMFDFLPPPGTNQVRLMSTTEH